MKSKKISLPKGKYIKKIEIDDDGLDVQFAHKKKIALLFVSVNERYWSYLKQVVEDCKTNFLPQHHVDYFVWTDMPQEQCKDVTVIETEPIEWPAPTLMRYHLFLAQEEKLKEYDYIFYLDADMRVVQKISDEILGEGLTAAPHPGYAVNKRMIPPYEPNKDSEAYIPRLGYLSDEDGKQRFIPFYAAGGFQGGTSKFFIKAMKTMRTMIDKDFNRNYIAIWNDESHWNRYLWDYQKKGKPIKFLDVSYVYPDSLINEYYIPLWGKKFEPKIITLTKPFSLSKLGGTELAEMMGKNPPPLQECPECHDKFDIPNKIKRIIQCPGTGKPHQMDLEKI